MIGQDILTNKINNLTLDSLPHSLILLGDSGSGRHTLFNLIRDRLDIPSFDITENISKDIIDEIYLKTEPILYLIDIDSISVKEENMLLKLVEEPSNSVYNIFIAKNKTTILPTILNRCQIWELQKYSEEQLRFFLTTITDDYPRYFDILEFCNTPGQVSSFVSFQYSIKDLKDLCNKIIDRVAGAKFSNTLTISNKIAFNNEVDKWSYDVFIKVFQHCVKMRFLSEGNQKFFNAYKVVNQLCRDSQIPHINKKHLFENCLFVLSKILR